MDDETTVHSTLSLSLLENLLLLTTTYFPHRSWGSVRYNTPYPTDGAPRC